MEDSTNIPNPSPDNGASSSAPNVDITYAAPPATANTSGLVQPPVSPPHPMVPPTSTNNNRVIKFVLIVIATVVVLGVASFIAYTYGKHKIKSQDAKIAANSLSTKIMSVPQGATIVEQCAPGLGTQYVLPKDIPNGPIYNIYRGKLIGIQYMINSVSLQTATRTVSNLPLFSQSYDHIDVMEMDAHAGFPGPHFEVDLMLISHDAASKITCGDSMSMTNGQM